MPPTVHRDDVDGSGPSRSPNGRPAVCSCSCTTPGSMTAVRDSSSMEWIRLRCRATSITNPGPTALPAHEVPAPRAVIGIPTLSAARTTAISSSEVRGRATATGSTR